jgi:hypothetical protein
VSAALPDRLRAACAQIAAHARHVQLVEERVVPYAGALPDLPPIGSAEPLHARPERERGAALWLTLDAINFGSGWFPTLRKRPGLSGYGTIAAGLRERFEQVGPWSAGELAAIGAPELARVLGQEPEHELVGLFARSLRWLGGRLMAEHDGRFLGAVEEAGESAVTLVERLAGWECFADVAVYGEHEVPFLKRAQIAAADLSRAGVARFADLQRLTMFADNLVPHVLRLDGVLRFSDELAGRIEAGELLEHGSPEEVEMRACAVQAVELLVAARPGLCAAAIDQWLWERGGGAEYKARPRPRCRCTAY